jgi:S-(hydroxymethyl)glutathione dehydrogenase/alcohol dehydrogenase
MLYSAMRGAWLIKKPQTDGSKGARRKVRAAVCRAFGQPLCIEDLVIAAPERKEVRVRLTACAICHSDVMFADGAWGGDLPAVYGHEASGVVESVGADVLDLKAGDHVVVTLIRSCGQCRYCTQSVETQCEGVFQRGISTPLTDVSGNPIVQGLNSGAFAEMVVVDQSQVCAIPKNIPLDVASILACGVLTGYGAVANTARVSAGSSVAVIGCGGVGVNSIQAAAIAGAHSIIAIDVLDAKLELARAFGATHVINAQREQAVERVLAITAQRGVDFALITVGAKSAAEQALALLARAGTVVVVGMPASGVVAEYDPGELASKGQSLLGSKMGSSSVKRDIPRLVDLYQCGALKLDELISGRYRLDDINEAIASVKRGEALRNLVIF